MAYAAITFGQLTSALAGRLGDPTNQFWGVGELQRILVESLRTFNALTSFWKARGVFPAVSGQTFYDLPTVLPALRGMTVTDQLLVGMMEEALSEPYSPTVWIGTDQFNLADLTAAVQRRRDQWLLETGQVIVQATVNGPAVPSTRFALPSTIIDVRRAGWIDGSGYEQVLHREDAWALNAFTPGWNLTPTGTPYAYSVGTVPPLQMQVAPAPQQSGKFRLLIIQTGAALNPATGVVLGVPDDWTWAVRFGALADLLAQSGPAQDLPRASYCQQRWLQAIDAAKQWSVVLTATVDDAYVPVLSTQEADDYLPGWINTRGMPAQALVAGSNGLSLAPVADANFLTQPYSVSLDVLQNAPIPVNPGDEVSLAGELIDGLLGYGVHLGSFKLGGAEFAATSGLLDAFYGVCGVDVKHLAAASPNRDHLLAASGRGEAQTEREAVR